MSKDFRTINREVMTNTYELCMKINSLKKSIDYSINNQKVILENDNITRDNNIKLNTEIYISKKRTYEAAGAYKNYKVAILNFANNHSIGGAPYYAGAQEEALCRCSTLLPCLKACTNTFYQPHRDAFTRGEIDNYGNNDIIYTPNVTVFKTDTLEPELLDENDWYNVDVITCAAPEVSKGYNFNKLCEIMYSRIKRILDVAEINKAEALILGAFGCGAFGNPPQLIANIFKDVLNTGNYNFKIIEFAVYTGSDTTNYDVFKNVLIKE